MSMQVSLTSFSGRSMSSRYPTMSLLRTPASRKGVRMPFSFPAAMPGRSSERSSTISPLTIAAIPSDSATFLIARYISVLQM